MNNFDPTTIENALGECTFSISLFAKNVANMKNGKKLSVMQDRLKSIPLEFGDIVIKPYTFSPLGDVSDNHYGYHIRVINLQAFIKIA